MLPESERWSQHRMIHLAGKTSEVKNLIEQFGFQKLSDVPDEKLPELYEKAQVL